LSFQCIILAKDCVEVSESSCPIAKVPDTLMLMFHGQFISTITACAFAEIHTRLKIGMVKSDVRDVEGIPARGSGGKLDETKRIFSGQYCPTGCAHPESLTMSVVIENHH